ncbi:MAG: alcohol dehydrogenase catalytic domain-containing protein [Verrucomicrobiae bacterium]|nr:alcohol dehydrogenase catalytic domain-containing protein [Verrucomicrobiae bacterium]
MRSIITTGPNQLGVADVPEPVPGADEALVELKACGVCGSDLNAYRVGKAGQCIGHEFAGVVAKCGHSGRLREGDRVVLNVVGGCGRCEYCLAGQENYCPEIWTHGRHVKPGGYTEKVTYVERNCLIIPPEMSFETAIVTGGCGIGVAWHGIKRLNIQPGEWIPVFGVGPIGLSAVMLLRHLKAQPLALDQSEYRLNLATQCGAADKMSATQEGIEEKIKRLKVRAFILCTGNHQAAERALRMLRLGGTLLILGGLADWKFNSWEMIGVGDKTLMGSWHYHCNEWDKILELTKVDCP